MTRLILVFLLTLTAFAQTLPVALKNTIHPVTRQATDLGPLPESTPLTGLTLLLRPPPGRAAALGELLRSQQDPASPNYHQWLTPEQYAERFGASASDAAEVSRWLTAQGLRVTGTARTRLFVTFEGSAGSTARAFHTQFHAYRRGNKRHFANASEIALPAAISDLTAAVMGFHDFVPKSFATSATGVHNLTPDDLAVIYNTKPLRDAGTDGHGQKIVLLGQTNLDPTDINAFRLKYNLSGPPIQIIRATTGADPGTVPGYVAEADLDVEWSGAVAPGATLVYVYANSALSAALYALDQNLGSIISSSFGVCEPEELSILPAFEQLIQAANATGVTWVNASGDLGATGCEGQTAITAQNGRSIIFPASIPEVTAVGGTRFNDAAGNYWSPTNNANGGSALSYIPEMAWNDTLERGDISASGGGRSSFYSRPLWQFGLGVPTDTARHIPDVSFAGSPQHDGYASIANGKPGNYGGTSVSAPVFAGIVALLNQFTGSTGSGNLNPALYRMATATTGVFHDVTQGDNIVPCIKGTPDCPAGTTGYTAGPGYDEVTGLGSLDVSAFIHQFPLNPGNGSLVTITVAPNPIYQTPTDANGLSFKFSISLKEQNGKGTTLTGLSVGNVDYTPQINNFFGTPIIPPYGVLYTSLGARNQVVPANMVIAVSGIDLGGRFWSQQTTVQLLAAQAGIGVTGFTNAADFAQAYAPGMILSVFGSTLGSSTQAAGLTPLLTYMAGTNATVNNISAPLYYVSPTQLNIQIPYEAGPGPGTLTIYNGTQSVSRPINISAAAPGIFTAVDKSLVPYNSGAPGQTLLAFITGEGAVSPAIATGTTPDPRTPFNLLPQPVLPVTVTVGGIPAKVAFAGIPSGLVGATQVNFIIPPTVPPGVQPVVVTVGTVASPPATITVTAPVAAQ